MTKRTVAPGDTDFKEKVRRWLREHVGEPVGPGGKHLPIPHLRAIPKPPCAECDEAAWFFLEGWFANGDRVEIPLCRVHSGEATAFIEKRKQELVERDNQRRQRKYGHP